VRRRSGHRVTTPLVAKGAIGHGLDQRGGHRFLSSMKSRETALSGGVSIAI
jgi:hypothetical protein